MRIGWRQMVIVVFGVALALTLAVLAGLLASSLAAPAPGATETKNAGDVTTAGSQVEAATPPSRMATSSPAPAMASLTFTPELESTTAPPPEATTSQPTRLVTAASPTPAGPTPTYVDDPSVLLTPSPVPPTETPTVAPLTGLDGMVELVVAQVRRIRQPDGDVLMADVSNPTDQPVRDVSLVFTRLDGARVGEAKPLSLHLVPYDTRPGATTPISPNDPVIIGWMTLQVHAVGTVVAAQAGEPGYPVMLDISHPAVGLDQTTYTYETTVTNITGRPVRIVYQNIAFFGSDGSLLLVLNLGPHDALAEGESYVLRGLIPRNQPAAEGHTLAEYTDVLVTISAEAGP